ncbi:MAG: trehalose-phosphatase [Gammaproteobacteria bacterium]
MTRTATNLKPRPPVRHPEDWALFLDVDGTLLGFRDDPAEVVSTPGLNALLAGLGEGLSGALAVVSGRPVQDIDRIFRPLVLPAAGAHGLEIRMHPEDDVEYRKGTRLPDPVMDRLQAFVAARPGVLLEHKPRGVALHYRRAPGAADEVRAEMHAIDEELGASFRLLEGKMVCELMPGGRSKGKAIEDFMTVAPFAGRVPVFVGDDVTDEAGFSVVNELGGHSVQVTDPARDAGTLARWSLPDIDAVSGWLSEVVAAL